MVHKLIMQANRHHFLEMNNVIIHAKFCSKLHSLILAQNFLTYLVAISELRKILSLLASILLGNPYIGHFLNCIFIITSQILMLHVT